MICLRRSLVRGVRTVFQKAAERSDRGRLQVTLSAGRDGLRIRLNATKILVEYHEPGALPAETVTVPLELFASWAGRGEDTITLEPVGDRVQVRWAENGHPQSANVVLTSLVPPFPAPPSTMISGPLPFSRRLPMLP